MTTIVAWLWQGLAIAALTAFGLNRMRHLNAATRHTIWCLALAAVVVLPIVQIGAAPPLAAARHGLDHPATASACSSGSGGSRGPSTPDRRRA